MRVRKEVVSCRCQMRAGAATPAGAARSMPAAESRVAWSLRLSGPRTTVSELSSYVKKSFTVNRFRPRRARRPRLGDSAGGDVI